MMGGCNVLKFIKCDFAWITVLAFRTLLPEKRWRTKVPEMFPGMFLRHKAITRSYINFRIESVSEHID